MKKITEQQLIESARSLRARIAEDGGFDAPDSKDDDYTFSRAANWLGDLPTRYLMPKALGGASTSFTDTNGTRGYRFTPDWNALGEAGYEGQDVVKDKTGRWQSSDGTIARDKKLINGLEMQALVRMAQNGQVPKDGGWKKENSMHQEALKKAGVQTPQTPAAQTPAPQTPAPQTPAAQTPAPQTPAPQTPAAQTPAPQTPAPQTPAPQTPAEGATGTYNGKKVVFTGGKWEYAK
jgi:hypothetical protein